MCSETPTHSKKAGLIKLLLANRISAAGLAELADLVDAKDLATILTHIYDLNERDILEISALGGLKAMFDNGKNNRRNNSFTKKIINGFRDDPRNKVVLVEGDSWFNYPVILTDVIDSLSMDKRLAVYSLAKGGDWLLNMLTGRKYVEELSVLHPDFFLISGGGNDIVGSRRLAAIIQPTPGDEFKKNEWASQLYKTADHSFLAFDQAKFDLGVQYLSTDFFALLMFFHLQYYTLMKGILTGGDTHVSKFPGIKILTQGYDYPIPSDDKNFGLDFTKWFIPFVRLFLGHGTWLKIPLQIRGINDPKLQRSILYAMIFLFNQMMIETGRRFNKDGIRRVFHIDSRDSIGEDGWTDELHAQPKHFLNTGKAFAFCIFDKDHAQATYDHVYVVTDLLKKSLI